MTDFEKAKKILADGGFTCVLCKDEEIYTSTSRGVKPLVNWYDKRINAEGFSAADKVIGRATAFLYVLLGVKEVYADVLSLPALEVLNKNGITAEYSQLVKNIINHSGDGICPFEETVVSISDKNEAYKAIKNKMEEIGIK